MGGRWTGVAQPERNNLRADTCLKQVHGGSVAELVGGDTLIAQTATLGDSSLSGLGQPLGCTRSSQGLAPTIREDPLSWLEIRLANPPVEHPETGAP